MQALRLRETAKLYSGVTRNRYGDFGLGTGTTVSCLYRDISSLNRNQQFTESVTIQGIFWLDPTSPARKGSVLLYQGQLYMVQRVIVAKELITTNDIHFIKCQVSLYRAIS